MYGTCCCPWAPISVPLKLFPRCSPRPPQVPPLLTRSAENIDIDPSEASLTDERSELAFDVFKVPCQLLPTPPEETSLPVKVTAHR